MTLNENLNFVIVGHVDHGKSTLIGRLLFDTDSLPEGKIDEIKAICESLGKDLEFGYVMDHLEEERDQGITIDTTQTFFKTDKRQYTIIDAPGHVEFVKNMITGASLAEAAILIVDADEGVQEQTKRHSYILSMLGIKQVLVVINKMDLVEYKQERCDEITNELKSFLIKLNIEPDYIIPISAKEGDNVAKKSENLSWYDGKTVLEALDTFKKSESLEEKELRLPIQDVYNFAKRMNVGMVASGTLKKGDSITILPSKETTTINTIEEWNKELEQAIAGRSTGFTTSSKVFIDRGNVITRSEESSPLVTNEFKAHVFWMDKTPFKDNERVLLRCSTQEVMCDVEIQKKMDSSTLETLDIDGELKNREVADVLIKTEKPIVVEDFNKTPELGRFVLERKDTCAGGIITNIE
jgi:sulfate adenylyltransferase large subunit